MTVEYFLVTLFNELDDQPVLKDMLYSKYLFGEGDGYVQSELNGSK